MTTASPPIAVTPAEWLIIAAILREHVPEATVLAFGSRVTGRAKPFSDLDLVIDAAHPLSLSCTADLTEAFTESDLPFRVDIVDWATTRPEFRAIMRRDGVVLPF